MSDELESQILKKMYLWLLAGGIGIGSVAGFGGFRPDPFTGTDGRLLERRIDSLESQMKRCLFRRDKGQSREQAAIRQLEVRCREPEGD